MGLGNAVLTVTQQIMNSQKRNTKKLLKCSHIMCLTATLQTFSLFLVCVVADQDVCYQLPTGDQTQTHVSVSVNFPSPTWLLP